MSVKLPKSLKSKTALLQEEIDFLRAQVAQLQNYILMVAPNPALTQAVPRAGSGVAADWVPHRLHTTELEEDIEYQLTEGLIDEDVAKMILEAAAKENEEIEVD